MKKARASLRYLLKGLSLGSFAELPVFQLLDTEVGRPEVVLAEDRLDMALAEDKLEVVPADNTGCIHMVVVQHSVPSIVDLFDVDNYQDRAGSMRVVVPYQCQLVAT